MKKILNFIMVQELADNEIKFKGSFIKRLIFQPFFCLLKNFHISLYQIYSYEEK